MAEVIPGIYQLKLPLPNIYLEHINTYLVRGDNECLLIDTGWDTKEAFDSLKKQLDEIGIDFKDISQIITTHVHPDHYGLAGRLKHLSNAKLAMHLIERDFIETRYVSMDNLLQQVAQWLHINGVPVSELFQLQTASVGMVKFVEPALPDVIFRGGETISISPFKFEVIWTPGHAPGHICLYDSTKQVLISGDHILPTISPHIGLHPQSSSNPLDDYIHSLNALRHMVARIILPGHENPFTGLGERIEELIHHHEQRNLEILETIAAKPKTGYQVSTEIIWMPTAGGVSWQDLPPEGRRIAVLETLAHLESLRFSGKVDKLSRNSTIYYQRA